MDAQLSFNFRPVKTAYFVDNTDLGTFSDIALFCCTQWGGIHNFIIPVASDGVLALFLDAIRMHMPDRVVSACVHHDQVVSELHAGDFPRLNPSGWQYFKAADKALHPLGLYPVKGERPDYKPHLLLYEDTPDSDDLISACRLAAFGGIWPGQRDHYSERFNLDEVDLGNPELPFIVRQIDTDPLVSPVNLTSTDIQVHRVENAVFSAHFDVVVVTGVVDLCWYWTRRAIDSVTQDLVNDYVRKTLLVPYQYFGNLRFFERLIATIREGFHRNPSQTTSMHINFVSGGDADALSELLYGFENEGLIRPLREEEDVSTTHRTTSSGESTVDTGLEPDQPLAYMRNAYFDLPGPYYEGLPTQSPRPHVFREGPNQIVAPAPSREIEFSRQVVRFDIQSEIWERYPRTARVEEYIHRNSIFTDYGLSLYLPPVNRETTWTLNLPSAFETLRLYFEERGYEVRLGTVGQQAASVLTFTGGWNRLEQASILRRRSVVRLFQSLMTKSAYERFHDAAEEFRSQLGRMEPVPVGATELLKAIADLEGAADRNLMALRRPSTLKQIKGMLFEREEIKLMQPKPNLLKLLDELVRLRLLVRGFLVVCEHCTTPTWYPLGQAEEDVTCPGCAKQSHLSVHVPGGERPWEYLLNATVNRAMDHGALAPIALLTKVAKERGQIHSPTIGLDVYTAGTSRMRGDFDVAFVHRQGLYAGEAKMGHELRDKDIKMGRLASELGCAGFYYASLEGFDEQSFKRIWQLRAELAEQPRPEFELVVYGPNDLLLEE